jgi:hypothetical protein
MPRQHTTDDLNYRRNRQTLLANNPPCHWCGKYGTKTNPMTADHLIEFDRGGSDDLDNLSASMPKLQQQTWRHIQSQKRRPKDTEPQQRRKPFF